MAGRKKLPDAVKVLRGTDQPCRTTGGDMDALTPLSNVKPPSWLSPVAKKIFKDKASQLISLKVLTSLDIDMLALYANAFAEVIECIKEIQTKGRAAEIRNDEGKIIGFMANPNYKIMNDMLLQVNRIGSQFGFSPASRASIASSMPKKENKDEFDDFFK